MGNSKNFIGQKIKEALKERRLKQIYICRVVGINASRMSNYVKGTREPDLETLSKIANALGQPLDYFNYSSVLKSAEEENLSFINFLKQKQNVSVDIITEAGVKRMQVPALKVVELIRPDVKEVEVLTCPNM
jgi:transcriptional regulator with XRE-family HTH domain